MRKYANEAAFAKALCKRLRNLSWFVQRIESGSTGRGIPDLYVVSPLGIAYWLELKRVKKEFFKNGYVEVPWRPGQQLWLKTVSSTYKQPAFTLVACDDCYVLISHDVRRKIWEKGRVRRGEEGVRAVGDLKELFE